MFDVTNSQQAARFGINPFQRIEIPLGPNIDRSNGEYFPSFEGSGMYIERADYPCLLSLVVKGDSIGQALPLRDGMQVEAWFKGFYLVHPLLNVPQTLSIILFKHPDSVFVQQAPTPCSRVSMMYSASTSGTLMTVKIYVPAGMRAVNNLVLSFPATTVTRAQLQGLDSNGGAIAAPSTVSQNVGGVVQTYPSGFASILCTQPVVVGTDVLLRFDKFILPSRAVEIDITITGTGIAVPDSMSGWFE